MKTAFVCAMILGVFAADGREPATNSTNRCVSNVVIRLPAPVAELTHNDGPTIEGVFLRVATAPKPLNMINPGAPAEYGTGRGLVVFTDDRYSNLNKGEVRPDGLRLLTLKPLW